MKRDNIEPNEYLHIFYKGILKRSIFFNDGDQKRYLFNIVSAIGRNN